MFVLPGGANAFGIESEVRSEIELINGRIDVCPTINDMTRVQFQGPSTYMRESPSGQPTPESNQGSD